MQKLNDRLIATLLGIGNVAVIIYVLLNLIDYPNLISYLASIIIGLYFITSLVFGLFFRQNIKLNIGLITSFMLLLALIASFRNIGFFFLGLLTLGATYIGFYLATSKTNKPFGNIVSTLVIIITLGGSLFYGKSLLLLLPNKKYEGETSKMLGKPMPPFQFTTLQGEVINSQNSTNKILVIDFWATWCKPCLAQFPSYSKAYEKYQADSTVKIIAVNTSGGNDSLPRVKSFVEKRNITFPIVYDSLGKFSAKAKIYSMPTTFVVNKQGIVVSIHRGFDENKDLFKILTREIDSLKKL
jgi:peroxiredoxin